MARKFKDKEVTDWFKAQACLYRRIVDKLPQI